MGGGAWPFLVGGAICLVNSVNERDLSLLTSYAECESSACVDYVPTLCTHRPSLLPIEWSGEVFGLRRRGRIIVDAPERTTRELVMLFYPAGEADEAGCRLPPSCCPCPLEVCLGPPSGGGRRHSPAKQQSPARIAPRNPTKRARSHAASREKTRRLSAMDISALASMKNVAKCDTWCELQNLANHCSGEVSLAADWAQVPWKGAPERAKYGGETDSKQVPRGKDEKDFEKRVKESLKLSRGKRMGAGDVPRSDVKRRPAGPPIDSRRGPVRIGVEDKAWVVKKPTETPSPRSWKLLDEIPLRVAPLTDLDLVGRRRCFVEPRHRIKSSKWAIFGKKNWRCGMNRKPGYGAQLRTNLESTKGVRRLRQQDGGHGSRIPLRSKGSRQNGSVTLGKGLALRAGHGSPSLEPIAAWIAEAASSRRERRRIGRGRIERLLAGPSAKEQSTQNCQMPRHLISDVHEWINEIPTVPVYYPAKPQPREWTWKNLRGKKTLLTLTLV
ncbi:hypothetical protein LOK49_LG08G00002 [Camellia lanceoleosa]|uniref:Uncharacterized protein n=1 Tax=Camellia lanceoleosa TaxID=1840588 RepID=A0ACC0GQ96_9ERIC|nr:hypothetical protein LOK49_LG08G00002 [Camellia lanceoleosa]